MNYQATIFGEHRNGETEVWLKVVVPTTSLCPCSKNLRLRRAQSAIAPDIDSATGRTHVAGRTDRNCEREASCEVYGILKRPDEKFVTERAYDNPNSSRIRCGRRGGAQQGQAHPCLYRRSENFESITIIRLRND